MGETAWHGYHTGSSEPLWRDRPSARLERPEDPAHGRPRPRVGVTKPTLAKRKARRRRKR